MPKPEINKNKQIRVFLGREAWTQHISDYRQSGLTQQDYAKKHNLNPTTFRNWIAKLSRECRSESPASSTFIPVKVNPALLNVDRNERALEIGDLHIRLPNGIECTFSTHQEPGLILPWIDTLRTLP